MHLTELPKPNKLMHYWILFFGSLFLCIAQATEKIVFDPELGCFIPAHHIRVISDGPSIVAADTETMDNRWIYSISVLDKKTLTTQHTITLSTSLHFMSLYSSSPDILVLATSWEEDDQGILILDLQKKKASWFSCAQLLREHVFSAKVDLVSTNRSRQIKSYWDPWHQSYFTSLPGAVCLKIKSNILKDKQGVLWFDHEKNIVCLMGLKLLYMEDKTKKLRWEMQDFSEKGTIEWSR